MSAIRAKIAARAKPDLSRDPFRYFVRIVLSLFPSTTAFFYMV